MESLSWRPAHLAPNAYPDEALLMAQRASDQSFLVLTADRANLALFALEDRPRLLVATRAAAALDPEAVPVALYEDRGELSLLAIDHRLVRCVLKNGTFERVAEWQGDFSTEDAFVYDPSVHGVWRIQAKLHGVSLLEGDHWKPIGALDLGLKISVTGKAPSFTAEVEGIGGIAFGGETKEQAESRAREDVSCSRYLAAYEPAGERVVVLGDLRFGALKAFKIKKSAIRALPAPEDIPKGRRDALELVHLSAHPITGRALLFPEPTNNYGDQPREALALDRKGWAPQKGQFFPSCRQVAAGPGVIGLFGAARVPLAGIEDPPGVSAFEPRALLTRYDGKAFAASREVLLNATEVVAGPRGALALGRNVFRLSEQGWTVEPVSSSSLVAGDQEDWSIGADGTVIGLQHPNKEFSKESFVPALRRASVTWDSEQKAVILFGGEGYEKGKSRCANATRAWKDGVWKELKATKKPRGRTVATMGYAPGIGVVMVGGFNKAHLSETCVFNGKTWEIFEGLGALDPSRAKFIGWDAPSRQLLLGSASDPGYENPDPPFFQLYRYLGQGQWEEIARIPFSGGRFGFRQVLNFGAAWDPLKREVIGAGIIDDGSGASGVVRASVGALLDRLPAALSPAAPKASALADQVHLIMKEEGVGKFWFAALDKNSWTARWGKRGAEPQQKISRFSKPELAAKDYQKRVQEKLDKGYRAAPNGEAAARLEGADAYPINWVKKKGAADHVYGLPPIEAKQWPRCKICERPMGFLGLFNADAARLPLLQHAALAVFQCEGRCQSWDPEAGANAVLLLERRVAPAPPPAGVNAPEARSISYGKPSFELDYLAEGIADERSPGGSKLGGTPTWVQSPETPSCDRCHAAMRLAVQIDSGETGMNFGDVGVGYVFRCPSEHQAKFLWQCS